MVSIDIRALLRKAATFDPKKMDSYADYQVYYNVVHKTRERIEAMGSDALEPLMDALRDDDYRVRGLAASLLGKIGDPRASGALRATYADEREPDTIKSLRNALSRLRDEQHIAQLVRELNHPDAAVRGEAVRLLSKTNEAALIPHILDALSDADPGVRNAAIVALGYSRIHTDNITNVLLGALSDPDDTVRLTAVTTVTRSQPKTSIIFEGLLAAAGDEDSIVRRAVIRALSEFNDERAIPVFIAHLTDSDHTVREAAVRGIHELSPPAALYPLISFIDDYVMIDDSPWFWLTAATLGEIGDPAAIPALIKMLQHPNDELRPAAVTALINIADVQMLLPLSELLTHPDGEVRLYAALILGRLGEREIIPVLEGLQRHDPFEQVREAATKAIALAEARAAEKGDLDYLLDKLHTLLDVEGLPKLDKIRETLRDLSRHRDDRVLEPLCVLTQNKFPSLRRAAIQALGNLRLSSTRPTLEVCTHDDSAMVRLAAHHALTQLDESHS